MNHIKIKSILVFFLVIILVLSLAIPVFAEESQDIESENLISEVSNSETIKKDPEPEIIEKPEKTENPIEIEEFVEIVHELETQGETDSDIEEGYEIENSSEKSSDENISESTTNSTIEEDTSKEQTTTEKITNIENTTGPIDTEEFTTEEETLTEEETNTEEFTVSNIKENGFSETISNTQIVTYNGYSVSLLDTTGISSLSVKEIDNNIIQINAEYYHYFFTWDGWYVDETQISTDINYTYVVNSDIVIESRASQNNIPINISIYSDEKDAEALTLFNSQKQWIEQGTYNISEQTMKDIAKTGIKENNTIAITDLMFSNFELQQIFSKSGLNYANYKFQLTFEGNILYLEAIISSSDFSKIGTEEPVIMALNEESTGPIVFAIDGIFTEWIDYPHVEILSYSGGDDAYSCIYRASTDTLFNVYTEMPAHLAEGGGEFTSGISVLLNDDWGLAFYPRFISIDSSGNINWNPQLVGLSEGIYHFYLASTDAWHTSTNTSNLHETDKIYGDAYICISDTRDEIEWRLDMNMIANKLNISPSEIKTVKVSYSRLGPEWTISAGTPTGFWGLIICIGIVGVGYTIYNKRK